MPSDTYPIEIDPPDLSPYRAGNTGIDYVTRFDSGVAGPHVLATALVHGNELCGAVALDFLLRANVRPQRGTLTLAFCNVAAFDNFDRAQPDRLALRRRGFQPRLGARSARRSASQRRADARPRRCARSSTPPTTCSTSIRCSTPRRRCMLCGPLEKGRAFARAVGYPRDDRQRRRPRRRKAHARLWRLRRSRPAPRTRC